MTSLALADLALNDNPRLQVGRITPGWYMCELLPEKYRHMKDGWDEWRKVRPHFLRDRQWVTALAYIPCPMNPWTGEPMERTRHPIIEIDGREVAPEYIWEAWQRIARFPIERSDWMKRRGLHAGW